MLLLTATVSPGFPQFQYLVLCFLFGLQALITSNSGFDRMQSDDLWKAIDTLQETVDTILKQRRSPESALLVKRLEVLEQTMHRVENAWPSIVQNVITVFALIGLLTTAAIAGLLTLHQSLLQSR